MSLKTILITGSTSGIGLAGAEELGRNGWKVLVHARTAERGAPVLDSLRNQVPEGQFDLVTGDLASLASVVELAKQVAQKTQALDVLWNNAGGMVGEKRLSADGVELQMAVNHLAPFLLTQRLQSLLEKSGHGRVIATSSMAHAFAREVDPWFDVRGKYSGWNTYAKSKLANVLFTQELAKRWMASRIKAHAFHPGWVRTAFGSSGSPSKFSLLGTLSALFALPPEKGADTGVFLASAPEAEQTSGSYWVQRKINAPSKTSPERALQLWEESSILVKDFLA